MPRPASEIPGTRVPGPIQTWLGISKPFETREVMRRRHGRVFRSSDSIAGEMIHVGDPALVKEVFQWKPDQYTVAEPRELMEPAVGAASLLLLDGQTHLRMRKLMLPPFHGEAIAGYADVIREVTEAEIAGWRLGQTVRMRTVAQAITMEVIIRAVFGIEDPKRRAEFRHYLPRLSSINPLVLLFQKDLGPRSPWGRFLRNRARVDELIYEEIRNRRDEGGAERSDILSLLLAARDEDGRPLSDRELRDELITLLLAGHETTATSIGWAFERLLRTPSALDRLTGEVRGGDEAAYLDAVIKETLRVRPVVTEVFRATTRPTRLGDYELDARTQLAVSIALVQLDPELYGPDAEEFRPERFLDGGASDAYTWIPFGGGVRRCIGAAFAQLEMKVVIATVLERAVLRASRSKPERALFRGVTVLPSRGGEAIVDRVAARAAATSASR